MEIISKIKIKKISHLFNGSTKNILAKLPVDILRDLTRLVKKYYWIPFGYDGPDLYNANYYLEAIRKKLKESIRVVNKRIKTIKDYSHNVTANQQKIIKRHGIGKKFVNLIKQIHLLAMMTDQRKECQFQSHVALGKIFSAMAKVASLPLWVFKYVTLQELKDHKGSLTKLLVLAKKRKSEAFFVYFTGGLPTFVYGEKAEKLESKLIPINTAVETFSGLVANKGLSGKTVGRVKVLISSNQLDKVKKGDILVTHMTTPEYVPGMRVASAIITDEGGITCHAAIVSRELNKPCIIGTKVATKVLKDGDLVEVDTNNGVIKKV